MFLPGWALSDRTASTTLSRMIRGVAPDRLLQRTGYHVLLGGVHEVAEGIARHDGLEGLGVDLIGAAAEEEGVDALHPLEEGGADVVVPIGDGPASMGKVP